jgi:hypothetical protein
MKPTTTKSNIPQSGRRHQVVTAFIGHGSHGVVNNQKRKDVIVEPLRCIFLIGLEDGVWFRDPELEWGMLGIVEGAGWDRGQVEAEPRARPETGKIKRVT